MAEAKIFMERLNNFNWASWKFRMELLLLKEDLNEVVTQPKPEQPTADWKTRDGKARATIGLALDNNQLCHVMGSTSANEMWTALKNYHERDSLTNKIHILRKLCSMRLVEGGDMSVHLMEMSELVHRLVALGEGLQEHWVVAILLSSLPGSYDALITSLESRPVEELKQDYVKGKLLDEWRRRCETRSVDKALKVSARGDGGEKKKMLCHYCKLEGHFRRDCPKLKVDEQTKEKEAQVKPPGKPQQKAKVTVTEESKKEELEMCFSISEEKCFVIGAGESGDENWYLDSGCTSYMTGKADFLDALKESGESVCLADGKKIPAEGVGTGKLTAIGENGMSKTITIKNVLFVPGLVGNVLSVSRITDEGYQVRFEPSGCQILKEDKVVVVGERKGGLYFLKRPNQQSLLSTVGHSNLCQHLWHRRL